MRTIKKIFSITENLIKREFNYLRMKPTNLLLFLTYRCTSRCNTCTMWKREALFRELSLEEWKGFIDSIRNLNIKNVEMFGGDALLRKDVLIPLIKYIKKEGKTTVDLVTNCNLLDNDTAKELLESGLSTIVVSVDGVGQLHDNVRGFSGSFENVKRGLSNLIRLRGSAKKPGIVANCTISSINIEGFEKVLDFSEEMGVDDVAFEYAGEFPQEALAASRVCGVEPQPYFTSRKPSLYLNREQALFLKQKMKALRNEKNKYKVRTVTRNVDVLGIDNLTNGIFPNKKCYICRYLITADPYGNIIPCPFFNNYYLGNIFDTEFSRIWGNEKHRNFVRHADEGKIAICKHCILGVERNATISQELKQAYLSFVNKGVDE